MTRSPPPERGSDFREYPKAVTPLNGGPVVIAWNEEEEAEALTGKKPPPPPTFRVEY